ncbi:MAG: C40 family peptidase [Maribacter sp.]|nr:C40 family peptidase [Maribacter sp.]
MNRKTKALSIFLTVFFLVACKIEKMKENPLQEHISYIKTAFAPDKRVALFNVKAINGQGKYVLRGESNLPKAVDALKEKLSSKSIDFIDSVQILPSSSLLGKTQGVIKISVANLRSKPAHSAELATQATLGTPVKIYKSFENWYLIQTPDKYLSWVDSGGIQLMDSVKANVWRSSHKIIFTETYGHTYSVQDKSSQVVSDIVAGGVLEKIEENNQFFKVKYPDGRMAYVSRAEAEDYDKWLENLNPSNETLVATSKTLMGIPYLWGGTSTKGVDCSGFTKTIFFLNGMVIPRDASQQVHTGQPIDATKSFENLVAGDLLFFGRKASDSIKEKVVHVGMWIGNNEFIHSSGRVQISSVDKNAGNYDAYNFNRYLRSKRILNSANEGMINLTKTPVFKD